MKTSFQRRVLHGLFWLLLSGLPPVLPGHAQTPQYMTYQGYLTDQNGTALGTNAPQNYDIVFRIWNQPTGAAGLLYGELQTVTVVNGYFSVLLGQGNSYVNNGVTDPRPPLSTVFTTNNSTSTVRYIEMTVKGLNSGADVTILPRLQLVSAPYAFMAANANSLVSPTTGNTLISSSGTNVTINGSIAANSVVGNITDLGGNIYLDNGAEIYAKNTAGTYEQCFYPRYTDNVTYLDYGSSGFNIRNDNYVSTMWMSPSGNVGIGTTSPISSLGYPGGWNGFHAYGGAGNNGLGIIEGAISARLHLRNDGGTVNSTQDFVVDDSANEVNFSWLGGGLGNRVNIMAFDQNGKVGIGTTTPQRLLTVSGPGASAQSDATYQAGIGNGANQLILGYDTIYNAGVIAASTYQTTWKNLALAPNGGNVGIGTVSPGYLLDVNGTEHVSGGLITGGNLGIGTALSAYALDANGYGRFASGIEIGTGSPNYAALEIDFASGNQPGYNPAGLLNTSGAHGSSSTSGDASIWAAGWIFAQEFAAFSDERIKVIKGQSESAADLKTLLGIKVTDYTYRDKLMNGSAPQKKVIAQQVEQVYPQAVTQGTGVVPDIYTNAIVEDGWVQLATDLKVGDRVKMISDAGAGVHEVLEVRTGAFRTDLKPSSRRNTAPHEGTEQVARSGSSLATNQVFVYGREVKDFRSVDYEAISMLNVSATQELAKELDQKSKEVTQLAAEVADLKKLVAQLAVESKRTKTAAETAVPRQHGARTTPGPEPILSASRDP